MSKHNNNILIYIIIGIVIIGISGVMVWGFTTKWGQPINVDLQKTKELLEEAKKSLSGKNKEIVSLSNIIETQLTKMNDDIKTAQNTADKAQTDANTGIGNALIVQNTANSAQNTANTGIDNALSAQNTANSAQAKADNALPKTGGTLTGPLTIDSSNEQILTLNRTGSDAAGANKKGWLQYNHNGTEKRRIGINNDGAMEKISYPGGTYSTTFGG